MTSTVPEEARAPAPSLNSASSGLQSAYPQGSVSSITQIPQVTRIPAPSLDSAFSELQNASFQTSVPQASTVSSLPEKTSFSTAALDSTSSLKGHTADSTLILPTEKKSANERQRIFYVNGHPSADKQTLEEFHVFGSLPKELRDKIWDHAVADLPSRYIDINAFIDDAWREKSNIHAICPEQLCAEPSGIPLLSVCYEARERGLKTHKHRLDCDRSLPLDYGENDLLAQAVDSAIMLHGERYKRSLMGRAQPLAWTHINLEKDTPSTYEICAAWMPRSIGENVRSLAAPVQWCDEFLATTHIYALKSLKQLIVLDDALVFAPSEGYFALSPLALEDRTIQLVFMLTRLAIKKPKWAKPVLMISPGKEHLETVIHKTTFHCLLEHVNEDEDIPFVEIPVLSHLVLHWPLASTMGP